MRPPELTVIVTSHNRADLVGETLASLAAQHWDGRWDILLADNASSDGTVEILESWVNRMPVSTRVLRADDRSDVCYLRNTAVAATAATSVVFVDDDDILGDGFVAAMGVALRTHQFVGATRDLTLLNNEQAAQVRGGAQGTERYEVFGAPNIPGGGCGSHRELWIRLGGNDESLGYGSEDTGLSLEVHLDGVKAAYVDDALYHVRLRTTALSSYRQGVMFAQARVRLAKRYRGRVVVEPPALSVVLRAWGGLLVRLPSLHDSERRTVWAWQFGRRVGHLTGTIRERFWYP